MFGGSTYLIHRCIAMEGNRIEPCVDRVGSVRKYYPICSSATSSLKISPSAEGRGLHYGLTLLLQSILRMLLRAFVCPSSSAPAERCMLNREMSSSLPPRRHANKQHTTEHITRTPHRTIKGHCAIDSVMQFLKTPIARNANTLPMKVHLRMQLLQYSRALRP